MSQPPSTFSTTYNNPQIISCQPSTTSRTMTVSASPNVILSTTYNNPQIISCQPSSTSRTMTVSTSYNNSQNILCQPSTNSRATTVSASPNVNLTRRSHSTEGIPYTTAPALNSSTSAANPINYSVTRMNQNNPLNYSSTPNIPSSYVLSPYYTSNQQNVRTSHGCAICNSSTYCHQCNMNSPGLEDPSNRYIYSNSSSERFVQNPQGSFQRITNSQIPSKTVLQTRTEGTPNLERLVSSISCPNISLQNMTSNISPVQRATVSPSLAMRDSLGSHSSPTNMPPPTVTASGIPTTTIPLRKLSSFSLPTFSHGQSTPAYGESLVSISSNQLTCTSSEIGSRLQPIQWAKANTPTPSNASGPNIKTEGGSMASASESSNLLSCPGATALDHSKITNIKQHRKRRKVNIIPLHKIVSFHQNYLKKCKSKTKLDHTTVKKEK